MDRSILHPCLVNFVWQIARNLQPHSRSLQLCVVYSSNFDPSLVYCHVRYIILHACEPLFFHKKVWSYPIQEENFPLHSNKQVKTIILNFRKFRQHFALVSKYTTWKRWHQFTPIMYAPGEKSKMQCLKFSQK